MDQQEFPLDGSDPGPAPRRRIRLDPRWGLVGLCLLVACSLLVIILQNRREQSHDGVILAAATRYQLPPALVKAVVWQESRFDAKARGGAGEIGLMQISKLAAQEWAESEALSAFEHRQLFDPKKNTLAGSWYLKKLLSRYAHTDQPLAYALADYNAGRKNVLRWIKGPAAQQSTLFLDQIDFPSTRRYVLSVMQRYQHYSQKAPPMGGTSPPSS